MSDAIITVENLSKAYLVGHQTGPQGRSRYVALRDVIGSEVRRFARKTIDAARGRQLLQGDEIEEFWALKDVSFEVKRGEVLGIIGRNGAGKSTLLKILSRITEPTRGRITLRGRVASLLEVGTGFHPELTGRENIFLNGAILGMTRGEILKKFDEIVDFAGIEKFLDTPVKRFSSGMYVRLAFAVAAHLEPEIMIVDEVLAVGDAEFQQKCLGKMSAVAHEDRTVLFVSHNMSAIQTLTQRCMLLQQGGIALLGTPKDVVNEYLTQPYETGGGKTNDLDAFRRYRNHDAQVKIVGIGVNGSSRNANGVPTVVLGTELTIEIHLDVRQRLHMAEVVIVLKTSQGENVVVLDSFDHNFGLFLDPGQSLIRVKLGDLPLAPGRYCVDVDIAIGGESCEPIFDFPLLSIVNEGQVTNWTHRPWGLLHCQAVEWSTAAS
jgi:lipopolysaccharide transport system ATP-binding protein